MIQISIKNGRDRFWQWDVNQQLVIRGVADTFHVHYEQEGIAKPLPVLPVKQADGSFLAPVPNILLQNAEEFTVYVYHTGTDEQYTKTFKRFYVAPKEKPAEYIYTETQLVTWEGMAQQCEAMLREAQAVLDLTDTAAGDAEEAANAAEGKAAEASEQAALAAKSAEDAATRAAGLQKFAVNTVEEMDELYDQTLDAAERAEYAAGLAFGNQERAEAAAEDRAGVIALDASGATVTLHDSAERPLRALTVGITATQSAGGTINGWSEAKVTACGKNRFNGVTVDGTGDTTKYRKVDLSHLKAGVYTASFSRPIYPQSQGGLTITQRTQDPNFPSSVVACVLNITDPANAYLQIRIYDDETGHLWPGDDQVHIQIEIGGDATEYEPFRGAIASVDFGREVYGGRYDWRTGELTVTHELADDGLTVQPLAVPEVAQLEPSALPSTLYPSTTVFANTGDVTLTYAADTKNYIDRRIRELIGG